MTTGYVGWRARYCGQSWIVVLMMKDVSKGRKVFVKAADGPIATELEELNVPDCPALLVGIRALIAICGMATLGRVLCRGWRR